MSVSTDPRTTATKSKPIFKAIFEDWSYYYDGLEIAYRFDFDPEDDGRQLIVDMLNFKQWAFENDMCDNAANTRSQNYNEYTFGDFFRNITTRNMEDYFESLDKTASVRELKKAGLYS